MNRFSEKFKNGDFGPNYYDSFTPFWAKKIEKIASSLCSIY